MRYFMPLLMDIIPKVNQIVRLGIEHTYYDILGQHTSYDNTKIKNCQKYYSFH